MVTVQNSEVLLDKLSYTEPVTEVSFLPGNKMKHQ
jgi:hypothetical protein